MQSSTVSSDSFEIFAVGFFLWISRYRALKGPQTFSTYAASVRKAMVEWRAKSVDARGNPREGMATKTVNPMIGCNEHPLSFRSKARSQYCARDAIHHARSLATVFGTEGGPRSLLQSRRPFALGFACHLPLSRTGSAPRL